MITGLCLLATSKEPLGPLGAQQRRRVGNACPSLPSGPQSDSLGTSTRMWPLPLPSSAAGPLYPESRTPPVVCQTYRRADSSTWHPLRSTHSTAAAPAMVQTKHRLKRSAKKTNPQPQEHLAATSYLVLEPKTHRFSPPFRPKSNSHFKEVNEK